MSSDNPSSTNATSTLQSVVDTATGYVQQGIAAVTGSTGDQAKADQYKGKAEAESDLSHAAAKAGPFSISSTGAVAKDSTDRSQGKWDQTMGSAKETVGNLLGNESLKQQGREQNLQGQGQEAKGQLTDLGQGIGDRIQGTVGAGVAGFTGDRDAQAKYNAIHDEGKSRQRGVELELEKEYHDPTRTYNDLVQALSRFPGFSPRTDVYTFENGAPALLVHIVGVLPVAFRGATYRFPIALWIPHAYPREAPIIYVTPTDDMLVRPGQHVSGDGKVYHHYLAHWREAWDRANVVDFLSILSGIFTKEPPVMSKQQTQRPPHQPQPAVPPRPPLPGEVERHSSLLSRPATQQGPPPPPPKQPTETGVRTSSPDQARLGRYDAPPPLPGEAQPPLRLQSVYHHHSRENGRVSQPPRQFHNLPQRGSSLRESQPQQQWQGQPRPTPDQRILQQQRPHSQYPQQPPPLLQHQQIPLPHQQPPQLPPQQPVPPQQYPSHPQPPGPPPHQQPHHHPPHPPHHQPQPPPAPKPPQQDLLSSPFDLPLPVASTPPPAPPIPRNPEKDALLSHLSSVLTSTLHQSIAQSSTALPPLQSQHSALTGTLNTLNNEITQLQTLQGTLTSNISLLRESLSSADKTIASARARAQRGDVPSVDEMLIPPHTVSRQLYDVVTEERGIEAAILALQEAFVRRRVDGDVWARRTRELAREGFRRKWVGGKVGRGLGLEG